MNDYRVAIVGATGLVGQEFMKVLKQRHFPMASVELFASERSVGKKLVIGDDELEVKEATSESFLEIDIALFSAGSEVSRHLSPIAAKSLRKPVHTSTRHSSDACSSTTTNARW